MTDTTPSAPSTSASRAAEAKEAVKRALADRLRALPDMASHVLASIAEAPQWAAAKAASCLASDEDYPVTTTSAASQTSGASQVVSVTEHVNAFEHNRAALAQLLAGSGVQRLLLIGDPFKTHIFVNPSDDHASLAATAAGTPDISYCYGSIEHRDGKVWAHVPPNVPTAAVDAPLRQLLHELGRDDVKVVEPPTVELSADEGSSSASTAGPHSDAEWIGEHDVDEEGGIDHWVAILRVAGKNGRLDDARRNQWTTLDPEHRDRIQQKLGRADWSKVAHLLLSTPSEGSGAGSTASSWRARVGQPAPRKRSPAAPQAPHWREAVSASQNIAELSYLIAIDRGKSREIAVFEDSDGAVLFGRRHDLLGEPLSTGSVTFSRNRFGPNEFSVAGVDVGKVKRAITELVEADGARLTYPKEYGSFTKVVFRQGGPSTEVRHSGPPKLEPPLPPDSIGAALKLTADQCSKWPPEPTYRQTADAFVAAVVALPKRPYELTIDAIKSALDDEEKFSYLMRLVNGARPSSSASGSGAAAARSHSDSLEREQAVPSLDSMYQPSKFTSSQAQILHDFFNVAETGGSRSMIVKQTASRVFFSREEGGDEEDMSSLSPGAVILGVGTATYTIVGVDKPTVFLTGDVSVDAVKAAVKAVVSDPRVNVGGADLTYGAYRATGEGARNRQRGERIAVSDTIPGFAAADIDRLVWIAGEPPRGRGFDDDSGKGKEKVEEDEYPPPGDDPRDGGDPAALLSDLEREFFQASVRALAQLLNEPRLQGRYGFVDWRIRQVEDVFLLGEHNSFDRLPKSQSGQIRFGTLVFHRRRLPGNVIYIVGGTGFDVSAAQAAVQGWLADSGLENPYSRPIRVVTGRPDGWAPRATATSTDAPTT